MLKRVLTHTVACLVFATSARSEVLTRWTQATLPQHSLGTSALVIPFAPDKAAEIRNAASRGYRVYIEVPLAQTADAEKTLGKLPVVGFIVEPGNSKDADKQVEKLRADNPKLPLRVLSTNGKQPQMRGQTVTTRDGVLQVSSPTAQPWLDSNLAMVRLERSFHPNVTPIYSFAWELTDSLQQESGPSADEYMLAVAESAALHADLVLPLHPSLEKGLLEDQPSARATWTKILSCIKFATGRNDTNMAPWSNIAIIADNYDDAYEPLNLMARHNLPFRVFSRANADALQHSKIAIALTPPGQQDSDTLNSFAEHGNTVMVADAKGKYPWQSVQPVEPTEQGRSYRVGKGQVFELSEPISDPETFAQEVRRLTLKDAELISLWNALTTIAVPYRDERTGEVVLDLVNFAGQPMRIQAQLKGSYSSIRYETPEQRCCQELPPVTRDGFTEFVLPSLVIAGRVHLKPAVMSKESTRH